MWFNHDHWLYWHFRCSIRKLLITRSFISTYFILSLKKNITHFSARVVRLSPLTNRSYSRNKITSPTLTLLRPFCLCSVGIIFLWPWITSQFCPDYSSFTQQKQREVYDTNNQFCKQWSISLVLVSQYNRPKRYTYVNTIKDTRRCWIDSVLVLSAIR